ncbi:MAG: M4 thermolysin family metalloprotease precursor [Bacteroidetes bacterium]|nr:MAG: M4 thermolysin family metalloprotease precursor [Bacteroidota bacterium]
MPEASCAIRRAYYPIGRAEQEIALTRIIQCIMKKVIITSLAALPLLFIASGIAGDKAHSSTGGSPIAKTGSPGDGNNCTQCHAGTVTQQPGLITTDIPGTGYTPGFIYQVTATVNFAGRNKFGFQLSPQTSTGQQRGTLVATNTAETMTQGAGKYITHRTAGTAGSGTRTWTFSWIAPASASGAVTFYGAFNSSNSNNLNSGDVVYLSTLTVQEDLSSVSETVSNVLDFSIYPNPAAGMISITAEPEVTATVQVFSIEGKKVFENAGAESGPNGKIEIDLAMLNPGVYFVSVGYSGKQGVQKFIKL